MSCVGQLYSADGEERRKNVEKVRANNGIHCAMIITIRYNISRA